MVLSRPALSVWSTWIRALDIAWPVMIEKSLRTLMRTVDVLAAGFFSPAAVAAVGIADIFSGMLTSVGLGIGDATIALSSQDTGSGAVDNRNQAVSQAVLVAVLAGIPFAIFGVVFGGVAFSVLGAEREIVRLGGQYLAIVLVIAPMVHLSYVGTRAIQGVGDTRTPMYINGVANTINICGTIVLAFGIGPFPRLSVVGIAMATAIGETVAALLFLGVILGPWNDLRLVRPTDWTIARQLVTISLPRFAEGISEMLVQFPFNAILLVLGTEVNAAYHVARRIYRQAVNPLLIGYGIAANILVGQSLGRADPEAAYDNGVATVALGIATIGAVGLLLFACAEPIVRAFVHEPTTIAFGTQFTRAFAVAAAFNAAFYILAGSLRGGSETRSPLFATLTGSVLFLLGLSYVGGLYLGYGALAVYFAILLDYAWRTGWVGAIYYRRNWMDYGVTLMRARGSVPTTIDEGDD